MRNFNNSIIECDPHNEFIYKFNGNMKFGEDVQNKNTFFRK